MWQESFSRAVQEWVRLFKIQSWLRSVVKRQTAEERNSLTIFESQRSADQFVVELLPTDLLTEF